MSVTMRFRFLDLPAEIRNYVYKFAITTENPVKLTQRSKAPDQQPNQTLRDPFALSHVCRQIRQEFQPVQICKARFSVDFRELSAFIKTFYADGAEHYTKPRNVDIYLHPVSYGSWVQPPGVDVLPLLALAALHDDFHFTCSIDPELDWNRLQAVLDANKSDDPGWWEEESAYSATDCASLTKVFKIKDTEWIKDLRDGRFTKAHMYHAPEDFGEDSAIIFTYDRSHHKNALSLSRTATRHKSIQLRKALFESISCGYLPSHEDLCFAFVSLEETATEDPLEALMATFDD